MRLTQAAPQEEHVGRACLPSTWHASMTTEAAAQTVAASAQLLPKPSSDKLATMRAAHVAFLVAVLVGSFTFGCSRQDESKTTCDGCSDTDEETEQLETDAGPEPEDAGTESDAGEPEADSGVVLTPWRVWESAARALEQSPDNLPARAARLVEEGDPEEIFEFVRDNITTYPPSTNDMFDSESRMRWGTRATLRGGAGTPREKTELLAELYAAAGFEAKVVRGPAEDGISAEDILVRAQPQPFELGLDESQLESYDEVLGLRGHTEASIVDEDRSQTGALAETLAALASPERSVAFDSTLEQIPIVEVVVDGETTYANPLVADAEFGESLLAAEPRDAAEPGQTQRIRIAVEGARSDAPFERFPIIEHEFFADEVAGRRIQLAFSPAAPFAQQLTMHPGDVEVFVPTLAVHAPDLTDEEREAMHFVGTAFSRGGDRFEVSDGEVLLNGEIPLGGGSTSSEDLERIDSATLAVSASGFPRVDVRVSVRDEDDQRVPGLGADAFSLFEDGEAMAFSVRQNSAPPPRVMLLFDTSTSLPEDFRGAGAVTLGNEIVGRLYEEFPNAQVRVGVVNFGVDFAEEQWALDEVDASAQVGWVETQAYGSELWQALSDANAEGPTVIVLVTDGDSTDEEEPKYRSGIAGGAPVYAIGVGPVVEDTLDAFAQLSGGEAVTLEDQTEAIDSAFEYIRIRSAQDYILSYTAPLAGEQVREVEVSLDGGRVSGASNYEVVEEPAAVPQLSGLYLTVELDGRVATRTLAGLNRGYTTAYVEPTPEMFAEVDEMLFGRVVFSVEGAAPGLSTRIADYLHEKLRYEAVYDAVLDGDELLSETIAAKGAFLTPPDLLLMNTPLTEEAVETPLTFETGPRITAFTRRPHWDHGFIEAIDVFPLTRYRTVSSDAEEAWRLTLERTAYFGIAEAARRSKSTLSLLEDASLVAVGSGAVTSELPDLDDAQRSRWGLLAEPFRSEYTLVVSESGEPFAFWAIDDTTGSVVGILSDGSGGSIGEVEAELARTKVVLHQVQQAGGFIGVWAHIAEIEAELVARATITLLGGDPGDWSDPFLGPPCGAAEGAILGRIPGGALAGEVLGAIDDGLAVTGLNPDGVTPSLPGCP